MFDGYLLMPWAPEQGGGGLTFFEFDDPCNPVAIGSGFSRMMREPHSIGFSSMGGRWAVVDELGGIIKQNGVGVEFWDISDPTSPVAVSQIEFEGTIYPDAYARVTLSVFWQGRYVYAAGADTGIWIVDATDPRAPVLVGNHQFEPVMRTGQVQVIGNLMVVTTAEGARTALLDVSDPTSPQPIAGGDFQAVDSTGTPREAYFTNTTGGYVFYARKEGGGGVFIMDIHDPSNPTFAGDHVSDGNGGYVFVKGDLAFTGESSFAAIYDISDMSSISEVARFPADPEPMPGPPDKRTKCNDEPDYYPGDLDTATPIGNVVVLSVDDRACDGRASAVVPWSGEVDVTAPSVTWSWPSDGATELALTSRVGVTFDEFVDVKSAWEGSVRLYKTGTNPDETRVPGVVSAQESIVNFSPNCPLEPNTGYTFEISAGGITDFNRNPVAAPFTISFTTAGP